MRPKVTLDGSSSVQLSATQPTGAPMANSDTRGILQGREVAGTPNNPQQAGQISQVSDQVWGSPENPL